MKLIDKFLKKLNASRNTFATYILTLISVYLAVDRIVEMLIMIFTGVGMSYWGPFMYTFALACPVFAFLFSLQSEFASSKMSKVTLFYVYIIGLYIIAISMFTQWLNMSAWLLFLAVPNYTGIIAEFSDLVQPAFTALSLYIPLVTVFPMIKKIVLGVDDSKDMIRSIWDYKGIGLTKNTEGQGPYSCEIYLFPDKESGKKIKLIETKRYQPMLVCGGSGTGKTTLVFEPMMARDLEKKYFFREVSKEMGFTALKTGIAVLNSPYGNEYLNKNFNLKMLDPAYGKESLYRAYMKKMLLPSETELIYKNIGLTCMTPDIEVISHVKEVCENFGIKYNFIDPSSVNSLGLNPFVYDNPTKVAMTISTVLKGMYNTKHEQGDDLYDEDLSLRAIENITILLKEMYPRMNDGALPNLEDMLKLLTNFDLVEKMCKIMETDEKLKEKYEIQLAYFKYHFYKGGKGVESTQKAVYASVAQIDNLLRMPGVKNVLCNRRHNLNFEDMLEEGQVTFLCTRRGDLGATSHKAFGTFFLLAMQNATLSRKGTEAIRIPHFIYIDEFPEFICKSLETMFTMYRKYKVGVIISAQNLSQLTGEYDNNRFKNMILANCANKIFTGGCTPEDAEWWGKEFNRRRSWSSKNSMDTSKLQYDSKITDVKWDWEDYMKPAKLMALPFKTCGYKIQSTGKPQFGEAKLDFIEPKYKELHKVKEYDFSSYGKRNDGISPAMHPAYENPKFKLKDITFQDRDKGGEFDPVQNITDSKYLFDNEDAVSVKLRKHKKKKED